MNCPRCGSPVMVRGDRWECGWCLDSGELSHAPPRVRAPVRFVCHVDLIRALADLRAALSALAPRQADALAPSLGRAAVHQLSLSPLPENGKVEPLLLRDLRAFLGSKYDPGEAGETAARIGRGETLYAEEAALSEESFGRFWQSLLDALEEAHANSWQTDTDDFFRTLALFRSWRRGGPGNDPDYPDNVHRLQDAFHRRWEERRPEE